MRFYCQQVSKTWVTRDVDLLGNQDPKGSLMETKFYRAIADQLAIDFHWHRLIARYPELLCLKIFNFRDADFGTEHNVLEILYDFQIAESLKDNDVKETVVQCSMFEERKRTSIQAAVANQNKRAFVNRRVLRFNK